MTPPSVERLNRNLARSPRNIGDESRQGQSSDALCALGGDALRTLKRHSEMRHARNRIALKHVVGSHSRPLQGTKQLKHSIS